MRKLLIVAILLFVGLQPAQAQTATSDYSSDYLGPGWYEAEDYDSLPGFDCSGVSTFSNLAYSAGAYIALGAGDSCTIEMYGSSLVLYYRYTLNRLGNEIRGNAAVESWPTMWFPLNYVNGDLDQYIYGYSYPVPLPTSSFFELVLTGVGVYLDRIYISDPLAISTPLPTPTEINTPVDTPTAITGGGGGGVTVVAYVLNNGADNPARYYVTADGQVVAVDLSISVGDIGVAVMLFALVCLAIVYVGVTVWNHSRRSLSK